MHSVHVCRYTHQLRSHRPTGLDRGPGAPSTRRPATRSRLAQARHSDSPDGVIAPHRTLVIPSPPPDCARSGQWLHRPVTARSDQQLHRHQSTTCSGGGSTCKNGPVTAPFPLPWRGRGSSMTRTLHHLTWMASRGFRVTERVRSNRSQLHTDWFARRQANTRMDD